MSIDKFLRKYKTALYPSLGIVFIMLLSLFTLNFFWQRISQIRSQIATNESQKSVLNDRLSTLQSVVLEARESSSLVAFALPETSPAVFILNHINNLSQSNELVLDGLSVNLVSATNIEGQTSSLNKVSISFDLEGTYTNMYNFMSEISQVIPLVNLDSVEMDSSAGNSNVIARVSLSGYYAPFPTELPPLTSPLDDFTNEEKSTVNYLETFTRPTVTESELSVESGEKGRPNPFEEI